MSKKKNKRKIVKRSNFYRPKKFLTPHGELSFKCFKDFINNFIDPYDWGNNKRHFYRHNRKFKYGNTEGLNNTFIYVNEKGKKTKYNSYKLKNDEVRTHLYSHDKREFVYYVNSQFCHCPLICFDIDDLDITTDVDIQKVIEFLLKLHPGSYFEKSTNGKGLHFYVLMDFSDFKMDTEHFNDVFYSYAYLLKLVINTMFKVDFDNVKSTYSYYSFSKLNNCYLLEKCGTL